MRKWRRGGGKRKKQGAKERGAIGGKERREKWGKDEAGRQDGEDRAASPVWCLSMALTFPIPGQATLRTLNSPVWEVSLCYAVLVYSRQHSIMTVQIP